MEHLKPLNIKTNGIQLSRIGLGAMTIAMDPQSVATGTATIQAALDGGITFLNTADFYGSGQSEVLIKEALKGRRREDVFISLKFGAMIGPDGIYGIDVRPKTVKNYLNYSLKRLGVDYVDLYQPCRIDPNIPVEDTIGAVADMVKAGYVKNIGISEVDGDTLRRAHAAHPISMVEVQYSLLNRGIEQHVLPAAEELGIGVVAFGVLFNGIIGGRNPQEKLASLANRMPPAMMEQVKQKFPRLEALQQLAAAKGITVSQLAIAWTLAQSENILTIVGAKTQTQLVDMLQTVDVQLDAADLEKIEALFPKTEAPSSYMLPMNLDKDGLFVRG